MKKRTAYASKAIAATSDRQQRLIELGLALLITGILIGQLLLLISP